MRVCVCEHGGLPGKDSPLLPRTVSPQLLLKMWLEAGQRVSPGLCHASGRSPEHSLRDAPTAVCGAGGGGGGWEGSWSEAVQPRWTQVAGPGGRHTFRVKRGGMCPALVLPAGH